MKRLAAFAVCLLVPTFSLAGDKSVEGIWFGTLDIGLTKLRLAVHLKVKDGKLTVLDSLDQAALGLPIETVDFKDGKLTFQMPNLKASYDGKLNAAGDKFVGSFTQGQPFPLELKKVDKIPETARPQEPKRPLLYVEEDITYRNKRAGITFAGTLTMPKGSGPFPAVVLITGSGPQDRDESVFGHRPFFVLADYLTRKGIAVLRCDDRGVGKQRGGDVGLSTTADFAEDALHAIDYLIGRKEINSSRIGLLGHSEGGIAGPMAAANSKDVAFVVMLAGTALTGEEILYLQGAAILKASGVKDDATFAKQKAMQEGIFKIVKAEKDDAKAEKAITAFLQEQLDKLTPEEKKGLGDGAKAALEAQAKAVLTPWFRSFLTHDPRPDLKKVKCPVLSIVGELDVQVPAKENAVEIEKALREGGNKDFTVKVLPKLNHLFQTAKTGSLLEYGSIEETFAPSAMEMIADWILRRK